MRSGYIFLAVAIGVLIAVMAASILTDTGVGGSNVAVIPLTGPITTQASNTVFSSDATTSTDTVRFLERANEDDNIDAIVLEINSPGGSAVASDEIARAVENIDKPTVAWIREVGASGAYWAASEADHIVANRMSITGSVGVVASYLEFHDFLDDHNITYQRLVAGKHKDAGSPFAQLTNEQEALLQEKLDRIHTFFLDDIQENRNLTPAQRAEVESGIFFLGAEAKQLGLVDELGGRDEVRAHLNETLGEEPNYKRYETQKGILEQLATANTPALPIGIRIAAR